MATDTESEKHCSGKLFMPLGKQWYGRLYPGQETGAGTTCKGVCSEGEVLDLSPNITSKAGFYSQGGERMEN